MKNTKTADFRGGGGQVAYLPLLRWKSSKSVGVSVPYPIIVMGGGSGTAPSNVAVAIAFAFMPRIWICCLFSRVMSDSDEEFEA